MATELVTTVDETGPGFGRRDRKKLATRQALRFAALDLVAARGYARVTVEDIAEAADVSTRTFFNYFPSKEAAVVGADPERIEELLGSLRERPADESPVQALSAVMTEYAATIDEELGDLGEGREAWFRRLSIVRQDPDLHGAYVGHLAEIERSLCDALAARLGRDPQHDPYPALVTGTVLTAARVAGLYWSANGGTESLAALTRASLDCLANGLAENDGLLRAAPSVSTRRRKAR
ncbi:MAG TPA: TetR family transcriptional regulator [Acidimicrobiales bacterium]|jgi:AcrR family transcriptional regulator|nr:TetR family transcriptional regulator [Acidimicrobiales bacterium]